MIGGKEGLSLIAGGLASVAMMIAAVGAQSIDCRVIEESRKAVCNMKILQELNQINTRGIGGEFNSHDMIANQQRQQQLIRSRFNAGTTLPFPPFQPVKENDVDTIRLLTGDWTGYQTRPDGTKGVRIDYKVESVEAKVVRGVFGTANVIGDLVDRSLVLAPVASDGLEYKIVLQRIGAEQLQGRVLLVLSDGRMSPAGLIWLTKRLAPK